MMRPTSACTVGALQRAARLGLDGGGKVGVLDLLVAFECDAVEHGRFGQMHDEPLAGAFDGNLVEQAGRDQRFQRRVARGVVEMSVGRGVKIGADGLGVDAAVALDDDGSSRRRCVSATTGVAKINRDAVAASKPACSRQRLALVRRIASDPHVPPGLLLIELRSNCPRRAKKCLAQGELRATGQLPQFRHALLNRGIFSELSQCALHASAIERARDVRARTLRMRRRSQEHHMRYAALVAAALMLIQPAHAEKTPEIDPRASLGVVQQWIYNYRAKPDYAHVPAAVRVLFHSQTFKEPENAGIYLGFIAGAIGSNPAKAEQLIASFFPVAPEDEWVIVRAIAYSGLPDWRNVLRRVAPRMPARQVMIDGYLRASCRP